MSGHSTNAKHHHTKVGDALREAGHKVDLLGEKVGEKGDDLMNKGSEYVSHWRDEVGEYGSQVVTYIQENPVQSVVIAGVVGLILGKLFKFK